MADASYLIRLFLRGSGNRTLVIRLGQQGLVLAELSPQTLHVCCCCCCFIFGLGFFFYLDLFHLQK